jgi:hypothetical protein
LWQCFRLISKKSAPEIILTANPHQSIIIRNHQFPCLGLFPLDNLALQADRPDPEPLEYLPDVWVVVDAQNEPAFDTSQNGDHRTIKIFMGFILASRHKCMVTFEPTSKKSLTQAQRGKSCLPGVGLRF